MQGPDFGAPNRLDSCLVLLTRILTFGRVLGRDNLEDDKGPSLGAVAP